MEGSMVEHSLDEPKQKRKINKKILREIRKHVKDENH
jgi:hypothetical protein